MKLNELNLTQQRPLRWQRETFPLNRDCHCAPRGSAPFTQLLSETFKFVETTKEYKRYFQGDKIPWSTIKTIVFAQLNLPPKDMRSTYLMLVVFVSPQQRRSRQNSAITTSVSQDGLECCKPFILLTQRVLWYKDGDSPFKASTLLLRAIYDRN